MNEKSTGKDEYLDFSSYDGIGADDAVLTTTTSVISINTSTSEVTAHKIPEALASRMKENGFYEIVANEGVPGAVRCYMKYKEEGLIPGFQLSLCAHQHMRSVAGSTMPFDVDLQGQDEK